MRKIKIPNKYLKLARSQFAREGGIARAKKLTSRQRSAIAAVGARARWAKDRAITRAVNKWRKVFKLSKNAKYIPKLGEKYSGLGY